MSHDPYCEREDLDKQFGAANVDKWANLSNDDDVDDIAALIEERVDWAIRAADEDVDGKLRHGPYHVPFTEDSDGESVEVPGEITRLSATLAGVKLYESRGITDTNPETGQAVHKLMWHKRDAEKRLREIIAGTFRLDLPYKFTDYPRAIED